jgi:hypothetical protein
MRSCLATAALIAAMLVPAPLEAQEEVTGQAWVDFVTDWYVRSHHLLELEVGPKTLFSGGEWWGELTLTPAYEWVAAPRFELVVRTLLSWVRQNNELSTFEIRPVLGFRLYALQASAHRLMIRDFNRVESRNIWYDEARDWDSTWRYRNRLEFQLAINHKHLADAHTLYLLTDAEVFVNLSKAAEERFNDNWRFRAGLGYRIKYEWRVELIYILQITRDTLASDFQQSNNIIRLRIKFYPRTSLYQAIAARRARN